MSGVKMPRLDCPIAMARLESSPTLKSENRHTERCKLVVAENAVLKIGMNDDIIRYPRQSTND